MQFLANYKYSTALCPQLFALGNGILGAPHLLDADLFQRSRARSVDEEEALRAEPLEEIMSGVRV